MAKRWIPAALAFALWAGGAAAQVEEYQVKAAFLYNFAKFVRWPEYTFLSATAPISVCVLGRNPFGGVLEDTVAGKSVSGRAFLIRQVNDTAAACKCQIVFISASEKRRLPSILAVLQSASVLTVGESPGFADQGGVVGLKLEDGTVHFEINLEAARTKNLEISSKLLSLAKVVKP